MFKKRRRRKPDPVVVGPGNRLPLRDNSSGPVTHRQTVLFEANSFPRAGDSFEMGDHVFPILVERGGIPPTARELATALLPYHDLDATDENVDAATRIVADGIANLLCHLFPSTADGVRLWRARPGLRFESLRDVYRPLERGLDVLDFEIIKIISIMASAGSPLRALAG